MAQVAELTEGQFATIDWVLKRYRDAQDRTEGHIEAVANIAPDLDAWLRSLLEIVKSYKVTWVCCEERLPSIGKVVKCYAPDTPSSYFLGHRIRGGWARDTVGTAAVLTPNWQARLFLGVVTHWMEIRWPEPPAGASQSTKHETEGGST